MRKYVSSKYIFAALLTALMLGFLTGCKKDSNSSENLDSRAWQSIASKPSNQLPSNSNATSPGATFWTGTHIISWGDIVSGVTTNTGEIFDPGSNSWSSISTVNAPEPRTLFASAFSGTKLIVWGGTEEETDFIYNNGGIYNIATNTWSAMSQVNAPTARFNALSVWTGSKLIVFGGQQDYTSTTNNDGGVYDLATDTWTDMSTVNAPTTRRYASAVWTGDEMIVWGGAEFPQCSSCNYPTALNTGARYNPTTNTWTPISTNGAPSGRAGHVAVWTGSRMIIWGGGDFWLSIYQNDGALYDPQTDTWTPMSQEGALSARKLAGYVWTGESLIIFGGEDWHNSYFSDGAYYDPSKDSWKALPGSKAPTPRIRPSLIWTGSGLYVIGGNPKSGSSADVGGVLQDDLLPSPNSNFNPTPGALVSAWTNNNMPQAAAWNAITYGNGKFIALASSATSGGNGCNIGAVSNDGKNWTQTTLPSSSWWYSAAYGNGKFVAVSLTGAAASSVDGITWTGHTFPSVNNWYSVTFGGGTFVAVANSNSGSYSATSPDGINWTQHTLPNGQWSSVTYGNGVFVAVDDGGGNNVLTSSDGVNWTLRSMPTGLYKVEFGNGIFVAIGTGSKGAISSDGITWTQTRLSSFQSWISVTYGNGKFVALAHNSRVVAVSSDGISWLQKPLPTKTWWRALTFGGGIFVALDGLGSDGGGYSSWATSP
jgi:N-acetylneuraminic acid mutarotase